MDSLTQIVLGAAVGEAVLGKKVGNRAMFYGAVAGTIPDLDVFLSHVVDPIKALEWHRGVTHSVLFSVFFGMFSGWLISKWEKQASWQSWSLLMFLGLLTHALLDAHTTWGTQLFWPLDWRLAYKNIFVIDPLYTLPFMVFLVLASRLKKENPKRAYYNKMGLTISSLYLCVTLILKWFAYNEFKKALETQGIGYVELETKPSPLNTILWTANVELEDAFLIGDYSFFDTSPIQFKKYPKHHEWLQKLNKTEQLNILIKISEGWFTITEDYDCFYFNDLRFGILKSEGNKDTFVFSYKLQPQTNGTLQITEMPKNRADAKVLLRELWQRIKGR